MRRFALALAAVAFCMSGSLKVHGEDTTAPRGKANAAQLLKDMNRAVAFAGKSARSAKLDPADPHNQDFFAALKKTSEALQDLEKASVAKNETYWNALHRVAGAVQELRSAAAHLAGAPSGIADGVKKLDQAFDLYRSNFGKLAARKAKGGDLSEQEKKHAADLQAQAKSIVAALDALQAQVKESTVLLAQVKALLELTNALLVVPTTPDAYFTALYAVEDFEGSWEWTLYYVIHEESTFIEIFESTHTVCSSVEETYWICSDEVVFEAADWECLTVEVEVSFDVSVEITEVEMVEYEEYVETLDVEVESYTMIEDNDDDNDGVDDDEDADDDNDGVEDGQDLDDDGDGVVDCGDSDEDHDGISDDEDEDDDNDGVNDDEDADDDNDGVNDDEDADDDNDGVEDAEEGDLDEDGTPDHLDTDDDNDGVNDDEDADDDNDGVEDGEDADDDNDGVNDDDESHDE